MAGFLSLHHMGPCLLGQEEEEDYARTLLTRWSPTRIALYYVLIKGGS
jgi:hypothetical protein